MKPAGLPARPSSTNSSQPANTFTAFRPRNVGGTNAPSWTRPAGLPSTNLQIPAQYTDGYGYNAQPYQLPHHSYPDSANSNFTYLNPPQSHTFSQGRTFGDSNNYHLEHEAHITQWQSANATTDDVAGQNGNYAAATSGPRAVAHLSNHEIVSAGKPDSGVAAVVQGSDGKQKTVVRSGGGQTWQDPSLLEWDPSHFRLFVGNLAGEVTDESLLKAFAKYDSVQRARVIRDKRSTKSKGYGFVSFSDGDQYFQAAKDMQGKYIGSHPVLLRRSTTEIRPTNPNDKKKKHKGGKGGSHGGIHANTGSGVHKKPAKTRGGLKILG